MYLISNFFIYKNSIKCRRLQVIQVAFKKEKKNSNEKIQNLFSNGVYLVQNTLIPFIMCHILVLEITRNTRKFLGNKNKI